MRPSSSRSQLLRWWPVFLASALVAVALGSKTTQAQDVVYLFYMRKDLAHHLEHSPEKVVGKKVVVTDELTVIWPEVQQRKNVLDGEDFVLFDTTYFQCAVPTSSMGKHLQSIFDDAQRGYREATKKIEEVNEQQRTREISASQANDARRELYWELYRIWSNKPIATIFGKVDRAEFWGPVKGQEAGVDTETISIVVDRIEKPRRRWYKTLDE
jgi:hypothetical protein